MIRKYDFAVVGGGPSGAAVALCLARAGRTVAILEATAFDAERYGETLPPEINPVLKELGLWDSFSLLCPLEAPGIVSVWGSPEPYEQDFIRNPHGPGWHIDRNRFDEMLCQEAVKAGAELFVNCRGMDCARQSGLWQLGEIHAATLVDASGRNGLRIDGDASREKDDMLLAIALRIGFSDPPAPDLRTCVETTRSGWWYVTPLPGGDRMAMFFTDPVVYSTEGVSVADQLRHAPLAESRLRGGRIVGSRVVHAPSSLRISIFGEGWMSVGDSASSYDSLSGRGIFKALRQGAAAARALLSTDKRSSEEYAAEVRHQFVLHVRQRRAQYALEKRWNGSPFWLARRR